MVQGTILDTNNRLPVAIPAGNQLTMISKILITLAVIMLCMWTISNRGAKQPKLREIINPEVEKRKKIMLIASIGFMMLMVLAAGSVVFLEDTEAAIVTVHVINTQSGERSSYRVDREQVQNNSFTTLDGRIVYLAGVERMEIEALQPQ